MTAVYLLLALLFQGRPTGVAPASAKGAITGVAVNGLTGDPLANVRVTLARVDTSSPALGVLRELVRQDPRGGPTAEIPVPAGILEMMTSGSAARQQQLAESGDSPDPVDVNSEMALMNALPPPAEVHSVLIDPIGRISIVPAKTPPVETDASGRFAFYDLEPGSYRLIFAANGFVKQDYGQRGKLNGVLILVEAGKPAENLVSVVMRMTPTSTVTGHIADSNGQPLAAETVRLSQFTYDATGQKKIQTAVAVQSNDRGEYRFYRLTPGRYYLIAGDPPLGPNSLGTRFGPGTIENRITDNQYAEVYYPGTSNVSDATLLEIEPGAQISNLDLTLPLQGRHSIRGRVTYSDGGVPPWATIQLMGPDGSFVPGRRNLRYDPADGSFELNDVPSGSYVLEASLPPKTPPQPNPDRSPADAERELMLINAGLLPRTGGFWIVAPIVLAESDIDGLVLAPSSGASLSGHLEIELGKAPSPPPTNGRAITVQQLSIRFRSATDRSAGRFNYLQAPQAPVNPDGDFRAAGILSGEYWLRIETLPEGYYVKSVRIGESDVTNKTIALPASDGAQLHIVIANKTGQIDGVAQDAGKRLVPGAQAVLIPDRYQNRIELFHAVTTDAAGAFSIPAIEPGDYHLAVWPSLEPYSYFDPALIKRAEEKGVAIHVDESSKQTFTVEPLDAQ